MFCDRCQLYQSNPKTQEKIHMEATDLPSSEHVGTTANPSELERLLLAAVGNNEPFTHTAAALKGQSSIRLLFQEPLPEFTKASPLPRAFSAKQAAIEFTDFSEIPRIKGGARYNPEEASDPLLKKGWEVRVWRQRNKKMVILIATWVK